MMMALAWLCACVCSRALQCRSICVHRKACGCAALCAGSLTAFSTSDHFVALFTVCRRCSCQKAMAGMLYRWELVDGRALNLTLG